MCKYNYYSNTRKWQGGFQEYFDKPLLIYDILALESYDCGLVKLLPPENFVFRKVLISAASVFFFSFFLCLCAQKLENRLTDRIQIFTQGPWVE